MENVKTIDITPTWCEVLPLLVHVAEKGTPSEARKNAFTELQRMATLADSVKELRQALKDAQVLGLDLSIGSAYISRAYIEKQSALNARIDALLK